MNVLIKKCIARLTRSLLSKRKLRIKRRLGPIRPIYRPIYRPINSVYIRYAACGIFAGFASIMTMNKSQNKSNNNVLARSVLDRSYIIENMKKDINVNEIIKSLQKADPHKTHGIYNLDKIKELFNYWGVTDDATIYELFSVTDWENNGTINQFQLSAILALLHDDNATRTSMDKYLFACLNLDNSGYIHKEAFRSIMICILMIKYQIYGLSKVYSDETYYNIYENAEMCGLAKLKANQMCKNVFAFADKNHSDTLNFHDFKYWWHHGGYEVNEFHLPTDVKLKNTYLYSSHSTV